MHKHEINQILHILSKLSAKYVYAFLGVIVQMGHDHKPSMELYWTEDKLYRVPFCYSMKSRDRFITFWNIFVVQAMRTHQHKKEKIPVRTDYGKIRQIIYILNSKLS